MLIKLYKSFARPLLEHAPVTYNPHQMKILMKMFNGGSQNDYQVHRLYNGKLL